MHAETRFVPVQRGATVGQVLILTRNITDRRLREIGEEERGRQLQVTVDEKTRELEQEREDRLRESTKRQELEARAAFVSELLDGLADRMIIFDKAGEITYMNSAALDFFGYELPEVVGKSVRILVVPPYSDERAERILKGLLAGKEMQEEFIVRTKTGVTASMKAKIKHVGRNGASMYIAYLSGD
jgi:PAS domain S-box-containing protein